MIERLPDKRRRSAGPNADTDEGGRPPPGKR
ncbi:hypothetical protein BDSB_17460 [Burkholderia dolosa PC543]|nr:hypothetical protein BDSB_17460 [Burkholderia dolosa PC543]